MNQNATSCATEASQSTQKHVVIIDTDIGDDIDDALALALALNSPEIELLGVTTVFGDTRQRARLAAHLLHIFGYEHIPVAAGVEKPLEPRHAPSGVHQSAVLDDQTLTPAISTLTGPELIVQTARAHQGQLTLLCIGPLTNVAKALSIEPHLFMMVRKIIMMGGTSGLPFPEWNIRSDVRAAHIVMGAGIPVTMIGWNVTTRCQLRERDLAQIRQGNTAQLQLLSTLIALWQQHRPAWHPKRPYLHDPLAIVALCVPALLQFEEMTVSVLGSGPLKGFMVPRTHNGPLVCAATDIHVEEARNWIMQRLLTPLQAQTT